MEKIEILRGKPIFVGLSDPELEKLASLTEEQIFMADLNIIEEGDYSNSVFMIIKGEVEILKKIREDSMEVQSIAKLRAGDCFGEMSLIDVEPHSATVRALTETTVLKLNNENLRLFSKFSKDGFTLIVLNIARILSRRLRKADADITHLGTKPH